MPYVKRTVQITFDSDKLVFENTKQVEAFQAALGRMVFYQMTRASEDTTATGGITGKGGITDKGCSDLEICLTYKRDARPEERGFTMGAVSRENGEYSFHS